MFVVITCTVVLMVITYLSAGRIGGHWGLSELGKDTMHYRYKAYTVCTVHVHKLVRVHVDIHVRTVLILP